MSGIDWFGFLTVMADFRDQHELPDVSGEYLERYKSRLEAAGITSGSELQRLVAASRQFEYEGWPPPRLLELLAENPESAELEYGWNRRGITA